MKSIHAIRLLFLFENKDCQDCCLDLICIIIRFCSLEHSHEEINFSMLRRHQTLHVREGIHGGDGRKPDLSHCACKVLHSSSTPAPPPPPPPHSSSTTCNRLPANRPPALPRTPHKLVTTSQEQKMSASTNGSKSRTRPVQCLLEARVP